MRTEAADSHMKWWELGKKRGGEGREWDAKRGREKFGEVLVERNEGDLETYEEPVRGGVQRKLALIAK